MSELEDPDLIEAKVGATRHPHDHIARAVSTERRVYLLHPEACIRRHALAGVSLQYCEFSVAMDRGIDRTVWRDHQDQPVIVRIDQLDRDLVPYRALPEATR